VLPLVRETAFLKVCVGLPVWLRALSQRSSRVKNEEAGEEQEGEAAIQYQAYP
jgi:hypothetical protein